ncbi:MAG: ice-binding family protein [Verrucomicrobia bacterium]|nr:ice-binding family protein [Verrucomicrobiota bacterium]
MKTHRLSCLSLFALVLFAVDLNAQIVVPLGSAATFGVLGATSVTSTGTTVISGDVGISPGVSVTGSPSIVNGTVHLNDSTAQSAQADLTTAINFASGQAATVTGVTAFAGSTLLPGVYHSATTIGVTGTVTLDGNGSSDSVFIFQIGSTLTTAVGSQILLTNGARAENVFWQVGTSATLGNSSIFVGSVLAFTSVTVNPGATIDGRILASTGAVTLDSNAISVPVAAIPEPATTTALAGGVIGLLVAARKLRQRSAAKAAARRAA